MSIAQHLQHCRERASNHPGIKRAHLITMREEFAARAMQGILANSNQFHPVDAAQAAVKYADALIKELAHGR